MHVRESRDAGAAVVAAIEAKGGDAALFAADVTDVAAVRTMIAAIAARWQRLDVVVNSAAVRLEASVEDIDPAAWRHTLAVVLDGAFFCAQAALPLLRASPAGTIVNIGGMTGHIGAPQRAHVVTAKAGLAGLTRALAHSGGNAGRRKRGCVLGDSLGDAHAMYPPPLTCSACPVM